MCRDRLVLRNLPEVRTRDELQDFVEAKSKLTVDNILFGEEEGTAVVIFETDVGEFFSVINSGLCLTMNGKICSCGYCGGDGDFLGVFYLLL